MTELIAFADLHAHNFKEFDERMIGNSSTRLHHITETLYCMGEYALENGINTILFAGDLFHVRARVNTLVYNKVFDAISELSSKGIKFIMIPGNHDQLDNSDYPEHSLQPFSAIEGVTVLDRIGFHELFGISILTVPYSKNTNLVRDSIEKACSERGNLDKPAILLGHLGITGGLVGKGNYAMADAFTVEDLMPEYFKGIYLGHFHKYQLLGGHSHVMYTGAPIQHSFSDEGEAKGFVRISIDSKQISNEFVPMESISKVTVPTFHTISYPEDKDKLVERLNMARNQYYRILVSESDVEEVKSLMPDEAKYKLEITRKYEEQERTEVKVGMSFEEIVKTYAEEHNPQAVDLGLEILKEVSENRV